MLEHTKKPPIELKFLGPQANKTKAIKALKSFGFVNISDAVPWRDLFPEYTDEELAGVCLAGSRHKENMTQKQLSELTGIPQSHISGMENGKRAIGKKTAKTLARVLNINYRVFL
ncbi:MAG: helix-turn-helix transcriptional regulator [Desulfobacteraceae bacterium]|nr:helix-turn-helix transcriptional regulator [Desulfobacteraceae bacterium]MBC2720456.1 helix-turn-helix transcriptional regulator [Desulfobacteraceae bacterium]